MPPFLFGICSESETFISAINKCAWLQTLYAKNVCNGYCDKLHFVHCTFKKTFRLLSFKALNYYLRYIARCSACMIVSCFVNLTLKMTNLRQYRKFIPYSGFKETTASNFLQTTREYLSENNLVLFSVLF